MPIYEYKCKNCGKVFEVWTRSFQVESKICPGCQSSNVEKILSIPIIRMEKTKEPSTEVAAKDEAIEYYKKRGKFELAAKEAEKAGKDEWEIKRIREGKR